MPLIFHILYGLEMHVFGGIEKLVQLKIVYHNRYVIQCSRIKNCAVEGQYFIASVHVSQVLIYQKKCISSTQLSKMCVSSTRLSKIVQKCASQIFLNQIQKHASQGQCSLRLCSSKTYCIFLPFKINCTYFERVLFPNHR